MASKAAATQHGNQAAHRPPHLADREIHQSAFDRFAGHISNLVSGGLFFAGCVLIVVVWVPTMAFLPINTSQLIINTITTIITFLLVALLQNTGRRNEQAVNYKLNALARGLESLLEYEAGRDPGNVGKDIEDLRAAMGLEQKS